MEGQEFDRAWISYRFENEFHFYLTNFLLSSLPSCPYLRICCLVIFREREEKTENETDRQTSIWQRDIDWLSSVYSPNGDRTCNLLVYGMMSQSTEPPGQGYLSNFRQVALSFHFYNQQNGYNYTTHLLWNELVCVMCLFSTVYIT